MNSVMDVYQCGWEDRTEEYGGQMPAFDEASKIDFRLETLINKLVSIFQSKDTNSIIESCYTKTEPMLNAQRGERLEFSTISVTKEMPVFFESIGPKTIPCIPEALMKKRAEYARKISANKAKIQAWNAEMATPEYLDAMEILRKSDTAVIPDLRNARICLSKEIVDELSRLRDE
jgi:hypothetical protein